MVARTNAMGYDSFNKANDPMTGFSQNSDGPIGTEYILQDGTTRYGCACYLPTFIADPVAGMTTEEFMAAMFS
jgi:hypothetical protein